MFVAEERTRLMGVWWLNGLSMVEGKYYSLISGALIYA
jgi:hypothetical protein